MSGLAGGSCLLYFDVKFQPNFGMLISNFFDGDVYI
jgi:hypothetical protein